MGLCGRNRRNPKGIQVKMNKEQEKKNIRCKCRKLWGLNMFQAKAVCERCRTIVRARGELNEKQRRRNERNN